MRGSIGRTEGLGIGVVFLLLALAGVAQADERSTARRFEAVKKDEPSLFEE